MVEGKMVFSARPPIHSAFATHDRYVIGVGPAEAQLGDIVCTFLDSRLALVFRPTSATRRLPMDGPGYEVLHGGGFTLVGRAIVDLSTDEDRHPYKALLNPDKAIEVVQTDTSSISEHGAPWPATVSIDLPTLLLVTTPETYYSSRGFAKAKLNLLPREDLPAEPADMKVASISADKFDEELLKLRFDPRLRKHALGTGSAGIINLGATGYLSSTLQILYMLKPLRMDILSDKDVRRSSATGAALHDLFLHLHSSSLPVSPLALTRAMGWQDRHLHETDDVLEFFRKFTHFIYSKSLGERLYSTFESLFADIPANTRGVSTTEINTLEDSLRDYCEEYEGGKTDFRVIPPAFLIYVKHFLYNIERKTMETSRSKFTYPRVLDLNSCINKDTEHSPSDLLYQLHGVVVLEEVEPLPRFLLYLRPRLENQWLLLFNESVTYALESEVFEHNFRLGADTLPPGAPLRTPVLLLYLRMSILDSLLG
ncbi:hypothetical protein C8A03DRAFT_33534 [Achaetomium macrosporum]|uniref:USP domain-containing protein n=1 Tax=Achaetomium macrosporum TaxID=79813 RepID=A0AAN7CBR4_9PEZI|nr:hypothetical protein C8A03DRAFT_33534 [Achaetomium macrosporum]